MLRFLPVLPPLAMRLGGYALTAAAAWAAARRVSANGPRSEAREASLDRVPDGVDLTRSQEGDAARMDLDARLQRDLRLGENGPGIAADLSAMARLRVRRLRSGDALRAPGRDASREGEREG